MRSIHWLHISDFHLDANRSSLQNTVLTAMLDDIQRRCNEGLVVDFVLATGDFAFSGKKCQYALVEKFFQKLANTIKLPRKRIFCIPGNHDIDRDRQQTCFFGAQKKLHNQTEVYSFLESVEDRETLLQRLTNFHEFQEHFFKDQPRERTNDNLGYVAFIDIYEIQIAIIGLNSAWLSKGGQSDYGHILLGEKQVVSAINIVNGRKPDIVIGMGHHPFDFLRDFDRRLTRNLLERTCDFFHYGHLHDPDSSNFISHSGQCLMLASGASFESREAYNSYTSLSFNPLHARVEATFVQYNPSKGTFSYESKDSYSHEISTTVSCSVADLASALKLHSPDATDIAHYLSALLIGDASEVPIPTGSSTPFGAVHLLANLSDREVVTVTDDFLTVGRAIKLLHGRKELTEILANYSSQIVTYVQLLDDLCKDDIGLRSRLLEHNNYAQQLAGITSADPFHYISALLDELLAAEEWDNLRQLSKEVCELDDLATATKGKRILAFCLAHSTEREDHQHAVDLYQELVESNEAKAEDWASLATLLADNGENERAKEVVTRAVEAFPEGIDSFVDIGLKIVEATGNKEFREWLRFRK